MRWVDRLKDMLAGKITLTPDQVSSSNQCILGKWYNARGRQDFGHLPEFNKLGEAHDRLHTLVPQVVTEHNAGNSRVAEAKVNEVKVVSHQIVSLLDAIEHGYVGQNSSGAPAAPEPMLAAAAIPVNGNGSTVQIK